jgi:4-amino-4-deoxy-L-arabinose transferase-like glycosyltransferase
MQEQKAKWQNRVFYLLLAGFVVFNLATLANYGMTWDEAAQQHVGRVALDFVSGKTGQMDFLRPDLVYYGPFFEMLNQVFGNWMLHTFHLGFVDAFHVLIVLSAALAVLFSYLLFRRLFNGKVALMASVGLMLSARFVAHAHYNSKDIPLALFFLATIYFLHGGFFGRKLWEIFVASLAFGLGLAIRVDIILVLPIFFGAYFLSKWLESRFRLKGLIAKKDLTYILIFILTAALAVYLAWPSLWHNPMLLFEAMGYFWRHGWTGQVLYFGKVYLPADLPISYAPLFLLMSLPLAIWLFFAVGLYKLAKRIIQAIKYSDSGARSLLFPGLLLLFWIFGRVLMAVLPNTVRYDGVRHFLFLFPAIMAIAAIGLDAVWSKLKTVFGKFGKLVANIMLAAICASLLWEFYGIFPFGDSYFNEPTRILAGSHLENKLEVEYWGAT